MWGTVLPITLIKYAQQDSKPEIRMWRWLFSEMWFRGDWCFSTFVSNVYRVVFFPYRRTDGRRHCVEMWTRLNIRLHKYKCAPFWISYPRSSAITTDSITSLARNVLLHAFHVSVEFQTCSESVAQFRNHFHWQCLSRLHFINLEYKRL